MGSGAAITIIMMLGSIIFLSKMLWNEVTWPWMMVGGLLCLFTGTTQGFVAAGFVFLGAILSYGGMEKEEEEEEEEVIPPEPYERTIYYTRVGEVNDQGCEGSIYIPVIDVGNPKDHFERVVAKLNLPIITRTDTSVTMKMIGRKATWEGETVVVDWTVDDRMITYNAMSISNNHATDEVNSWNVKKLLGAFEAIT